MHKLPLSVVPPCKCRGSDIICTAKVQHGYTTNAQSIKHGLMNSIATVAMVKDTLAISIL